MPPLVIPNAVLVRLIWTNGGTPYAVNVLGARNPGAVSITQALTNTVGSAIKGAVASSGLADELSNVVALANVGMRNIAIANQPEFLDAAVPAGGVAAVALLPPQVSLCVTLRTALAGRSFRGRVFLPGFTEDSNDTGGSASADARTAGVAFITAVQDALDGSGLNLAVLSRTVPTATDVSAILVRDAVWDTQRRRATPGI